MKKVKKPEHAITYSVCIPNHNMSDTIERALKSVLNQLDNRYEVLVVDDGSSDNSVEIVSKLCEEYDTLRLISLQRDSRRKLGETRNFSIREARGEYVILHIDADDIWEPFINDFVEIFHRIENCLGEDILLSGQQINMGKRSFLVERGPYRNTHRAQDRDMWQRLAAEDRYQPLDHLVFRTRLERPINRKYAKVVKDLWYHMLYDMRKGTNKKRYVMGCIRGLFYSSNNSFSLKVRIIRATLVLPILVASKFADPLPPPANMRTHKEFIEYREKKRGTYSEIMKRYNASTNLDFLSEEARRIFSQKGD